MSSSRDSSGTTRQVRQPCRSLDLRMSPKMWSLTYRMSFPRTPSSLHTASDDPAQPWEDRPTQQPFLSWWAAWGHGLLAERWRLWRDGAGSRYLQSRRHSADGAPCWCPRGAYPCPRGGRRGALARVGRGLGLAGVTVGCGKKEAAEGPEGVPCFLASGDRQTAEQQLPRAGQA